MLTLPPDTAAVLLTLLSTFTQPTAQRVAVLVFAALLTPGRRTVANLLRTAGDLTDGDASSYRRVLSLARWQGLRLSALLVRLILRCWPGSGPIALVGDDTVTEHRGKKVYGKARHRDAVRSSKSYTAYRYGHKWVVLCILVRPFWAHRPWALPVLVALARSKQDNRQRGRPHQTPAQLMQLLIKLLLRWHPDRTFTFAGDTGFGTHELAALAQQRQRQLSLVSRFHADANLYEPPPPYAGKGRPRVKGDKLPSPQQVVATAARQALRVGWYGGGQRDVEVVSAVGHWYKSGQGLVAVRWVYVQDVTGTHRDDYLYSTDPDATPEQIIATYTARWNIETTFQEMRAYLGLETTCGRCAATVLRAEPSLFGLYGVVALLYAQVPGLAGTIGVNWEGKATATFADALTTVRRWLRVHWTFATSEHREAFAKLPQSLQNLLLNALAPAA